MYGNPSFLQTNQYGIAINHSISTSLRMWGGFAVLLDICEEGLFCAPMESVDWL